MTYIDLGNIGDLGKPVTTFIEKIAGAIGTIYEPWHIERIAKAEISADLIRREGEIKKEELQQRALTRVMAEETKKQMNIESITRKAIPLIDKSAKPENMEDDWISNFYDNCKMISDDEMQQLWAHILAGEANKPGSFSKRTINSVKFLSKKEAEMFTNIISFCWVINNSITPLIYSTSEPIYNRAFVDFDSLRHLDDIGLITFNNAEVQLIFKVNEINVFYEKKSVVLDFSKKTSKALQIGKVGLTYMGQELSRICRAKPVGGFLDYVLENWKRQGISATLRTNNK